MMIRIGIVGYGYWGPNIVRNFFEAPGCEVVALSDLVPERLERAKARYPTLRTTTRYEDLLEDPEIDAVVVATPVSSHFPLSAAALEAGKHVLVEKPMTATLDEAKKLLDLAQKQKRVLMVDHTFVYTGAVRKIRDLIEEGQLGDLYYFDSTRVNLGLFQHDVNVIWDLAVHDLSIMDFVMPCRPIGVSATGVSHLPGQPENVAYVSLFFEGNMIAHLHVNWLAPLKIRRTLIGGSKKMIVYDDLEVSEKIKVYDKGVAIEKDPNKIHQMLVGYRTGDMWAPQVPLSEALQTEAQHFLKCIEGEETPIADGKAGLRVVAILEAASLSAQERGRWVELDFGKAAQ